MRISKTLALAAIALVCSALIMPAEAYVGPGAGIGMIGSLLAVLAVVGLAIVSLVVLPFRMIAKKRRAKPAGEEAKPAE